MSLIDIKKVQEEAAKEVAEERMRKAKDRIKYKLAQLETAKTVVANTERELEDLYSAISQGN